MPKDTDPKPIEGQDLEPARHQHGHHHDADKDAAKAQEQRDKDKDGAPSKPLTRAPWPQAPTAMTNPRGPVTHEALEEESDESKDAKKEMEEL